MKTKVKITKNYNNGQFKKGDTGYIDGYISYNGSPCAIVICGEDFDLVPIGFLKRIE